MHFSQCQRLDKLNFLDIQFDMIWRALYEINEDDAIGKNCMSRQRSFFFCKPYAHPYNDGYDNDDAGNHINNDKIIKIFTPL